MDYKLGHLLFLFTLFTGCATYQSRIAESRNALQAGDCESGLKKLKELSEIDNGDQLAYLMDYGSALQICQKYQESNAVLEKAEKLVEQNDYHSMTRVAGATLINEEMLQYKGDAFEKMFLNISKAINYLQLNQLDDAMVEVRKINEKYKKFNSDSKKDYELNSFAQYLSGLIYEAERQFDDACIAYRQAFELDTSYRKIGLDALRICRWANRDVDVKKLSEKIQPTDEESYFEKGIGKNSKKDALLVVIYLQGMGPRKAPRGENHIAARLVPEASAIQKLKITVDEKIETEMKTETVYNVTNVAIKTLDNDYAALVGRRLGSRATKEVLAAQVRQKDQLLGSLLWLAMVASERADLRQWSLLPNTIQIAKIKVPAGVHTLKIQGIDGSNSIVESLPETKIEIGSNQIKILTYRTLK